MRLGVLSVCVLALAVVFAAGCKKQEAAPAPGQGAAVSIAQKNCPVMGGPINKDVYADHNGRRVYFCCPACVDEFKKDPEKYIAKVDAELKKPEAAAPESHEGHMHD